MGDVHIKLRCQANSFPPLPRRLPTSERGFIHAFGGIKGEKQNSLHLCKLPLCPRLKDQRCAPHAAKAKPFNISLERGVIVQHLNVSEQSSDGEVTSRCVCFSRPRLFQTLTFQMRKRTRSGINPPSLESLKLHIQVVKLKYAIRLIDRSGIGIRNNTTLTAGLSFFVFFVICGGSSIGIQSEDTRHLRILFRQTPACIARILLVWCQMWIFLFFFTRPAAHFYFMSWFQFFPLM